MTSLIRSIYRFLNGGILRYSKDLQKADIIACLLSSYHIPIIDIQALSLGADFSTNVYCGTTKSGQTYFVKVRKWNFQENSVRLLDFLHENGVAHILPPIRTQDGNLWHQKDECFLTVFPYVKGVNGVEQPLTTAQFNEFGRMIKQVHSLTLSPTVDRRMKREEYSPHFSDRLSTILDTLDLFPDNGLRIELILFLREKERELRRVLTRTKHLRESILSDPPQTVICHADMHGWNLLVAEDGGFFLVDWDEMLLAPKERDLMFIGSGIGGDASGTPHQQAAFFAGYQPDHVRLDLIAYYRYARIIEDIAIYCDVIFSGDLPGEELRQSLGYLISNFIPDGTIAKANKVYEQVSFNSPAADRPD
ncbi:MAG: phosphotransferase [Anaerolineae bacterium]|jgi:spectinomycin phosphotransferase|nr:phosphotransferase [Anaerolineae bacterium]